MVPERPANTASAAEVLVFERIRDELPGHWIALHSVGLTIHQAKPWAEIDFVLIGPPGVFCLEVKGGIVSREGGVWYTTPQHGVNAGKAQALKESPFEQVSSASAALFHFLDGRSAKIAKAITGYAVAAPDVAWTIQGPDIDRTLVYDQEDSVGSFVEFVERVTKRWTEKVGSKWNKRLETLGRADKQLVLDSIRGDFQLVPSLRASADIADRELVRLTDEQCALFSRLAENARVIAKGGAGTGKTVIAVEEARRVAIEGKRVLYTCYSRNLANHVGALLSSDPLITVRTLHGLMMDLVSASGRRAELPHVSEEDLTTLFLPELALEVVLDTLQDTAYDVVVIDEGQDLLRDSYVDVIEGLVGGSLRTGHWRIFLDPNQNIFRGVAASALQRLRSTDPVEWPLTVNCRNTAPIAAQVSLMSGVPLSEVLSPNGPDVEIRWYDSAEDERDLVDDVLRTLSREGLSPSRTVVLSRYRLDGSAMSAAANVVDVSRGAEHDGLDGIRFSTIASFKGLEADAVLLVDVDDLLSDDGLASVYVGASRAKVVLRVFVATSERNRFQQLAKEFGRTLIERSR
jgi:Nuclease-related domain/AAA domain